MLITNNNLDLFDYIIPLFNCYLFLSDRSTGYDNVFKKEMMRLY